jgi:hypothetical protein
VGKMQEYSKKLKKQQAKLQRENMVINFGSGLNIYR